MAVISTINLFRWFPFNAYKSLVQLIRVSCNGCFWTEFICSVVHDLLVEEENFFLCNIKIQGGNKSVW